MSEQDDDFLDSLGEIPMPLQDVLEEIEDSLESDIRPDEFTVDDIIKTGKFILQILTFICSKHLNVTNEEIAQIKTFFPLNASPEARATIPCSATPTLINLSGKSFLNFLIPKASTSATSKIIFLSLLANS